MPTQFPALVAQNFQTLRVLPLGEYAPDTYVIPIQPNGNSLLSSLLVLTVGVGVTVTVNYFQTTAGNEFEERTEITSHEVVSVGSTQASQILVTRIHSKVFAEVIVSGGSATLGLTTTVVSTVANEIDAALKKDGQPGNLLTDLGLPILTYDESAGEFYFLRSQGGALALSSDAIDGSTATFRGLVGTSFESIPSTPGGVISEVLIECPISDNLSGSYLDVSFDDGATFVRIVRGQNLSWNARGSLTQIAVRGNAADTSYQVIVNAGAV
jgi:hypothetical protein